MQRFLRHVDRQESLPNSSSADTPTKLLPSCIAILSVLDNNEFNSRTLSDACFVGSIVNVGAHKGYIDCLRMALRIGPVAKQSIVGMTTSSPLTA